MDKKEAKAQLEKACKKYKIDCDSVFQVSCARNIPVNDSYKAKALTKNRLESHLYAIKYFPYENLFIAWYLWEGARQGENFTVAANQIDVKSGYIFITTHYSGYKGRDLRAVYAFEPECLDEFVRRYVARTTAKH